MDNLDDFARCRVVLVAMPKPWLPVVVDELADSGFDWKSKSVLLCEGPQDSAALEKLAFLGAATGSILPLLSNGDPVYLVEGDRRALREARALLCEPNSRVITIARGQRALLSASVSFATSLALPLLTASAETLRACGVSPNDAQFLVDRLFQKTLRAYLKGGRKAWEGALSMQDRDEIREQVQALFRVSPFLASYFFENAVLVSQVFKQDPAWLGSLVNVAYPEASSQ